jgi:hypothetical protein
MRVLISSACAPVNANASAQTIAAAMRICEHFIFILASFLLFSLLWFSLFFSFVG